VEPVNTREAAEFLGRFPPFDVLPEDERTAVAESVELRTYVDGENILVEDAEPADHLYVVRDGAVELVHQEEVVDVLEPGECFGHPSLLTGMAPAFTVRDIQKITPELAYTTLMTTLSRLAEKGVLTQSRVPHQRAFDYRAAGSPSEFLATASREQANRMLEQFGDAALAAFAARLEALPPEQRERLRRAAGSD
jgi:predicted transcriptional regulator